MSNSHKNANVPEEKFSPSPYSTFPNENLQTYSNKSSLFLPPTKKLKPLLSQKVCPGGTGCPNYQALILLNKEIKKLYKSNEQLQKLVVIYKNGLNKKTKLFEDLLTEKSIKEPKENLTMSYSMKRENKEQTHLVNIPNLKKNANKKLSIRLHVKKTESNYNNGELHNEYFDYNNDDMCINTLSPKSNAPINFLPLFKNTNNYNYNNISKNNNNTRRLSSLGTKKQDKSLPNANVMNNKITSHYESIDRYSEKFFKDKPKYTSIFSLTSEYRDIYTIIEENSYLSKLRNITKSDEVFIQSIEEASTDTLVSYYDNVSTLIKDYIEMLKLNFRMRDFIKGSINLVDSVLNRNSESVLIANTCAILDCERASLFTYDKTTDMLVVYIGEGIKKCEIRVPKDKGIVGTVFMSGEMLKVDDAYHDKRFNKEVDKKTGFRTKNLICYPLTDKEGKSFGCIQAINKKNQVFDNQDEELLKYFSQQASAILMNMMNLDDNIVKIYRLQYLNEFTCELFKANNLFDFTRIIEAGLLTLFTCVNSQFLIYDKKKDKMMHYLNENKQIVECADLGIVSIVKKKKVIYPCSSIKISHEYNCLIDLESQDGILTFPITDQDKFYGIGQIPCASKINQNQTNKESAFLIIELLSKCIACWFNTFHLNN